MKLFRKRSGNTASKGRKQRTRDDQQKIQRPVFQLPINSPSSVPWDSASLDDRSLYTSPQKLEDSPPVVRQSKSMSSNYHTNVAPITSRARGINNKSRRGRNAEAQVSQRGKRFPWTSPENIELPPPPPPDTSPSVYSSASAALASLFTPPDERREDRDDVSSQKSSCSSSIDFDRENRLNLSDTELMGHHSPGKMRLTEDGLKRHERKSFKEQVLKREEKLRRPGFIGWKLQRETRHYFQDQLAERDAQLKEKIEKQQKQKRSLSTRRGSKLGAVPEATSHTFEQARRSPLVLGRQKGQQSSSKHFDMSDLSVAPLEVFSDVLSSSKRSPSVDLRQEAILRKERERQKEAQRMKKQQEAREYARIEQKRQEALNRQRILNSEPPKHKKLSFSRGEAVRKPPSSDPPAMLQQSNKEEGVECIIAVNEDKPAVADMVEASKDRGGVSSCETTAASSLSSMPCAVCSSGDREFIAVPCMHYCFCKDCVDDCLREGGICPICQTSEVTFFLVRG